MTLVAEVAVPLPLLHTFSYRLDHPEATSVAPGCRVKVPFGPRALTGFVMSVTDGQDGEGLKPISALVDLEPLISPAMLELALRMARRYFCGPGEALSAFLPAGVKRGARGRQTAVVFPVMPEAGDQLANWRRDGKRSKQRELLETLVGQPDGIPRQTLIRTHRCSDSPIKTLQKHGLVRSRFEYRRDDVFARLEIRSDNAPVLAPEQEAAQERIRSAIEAEERRSFLLYGVTGSGKTEVYLGAIETALERGRGAIVLVPEISLTPQTVERFESRFGNVAVLHSHLTDAERAHQWAEIQKGEKSIAIGPRSAVFAPVPRLGLIIIDEEHETTFKQQNAPRYHARDVALMRAEIEGAVVVLGSATPSLESWDAAVRGEIDLLRMPTRIHRAALPEVTLIDMRSQSRSGPGGLFSPLLLSMMTRTLERREQILVFLNRRGFHTAVVCKRCGFVVSCRDCDIPMTYYRSQQTLLCHYCNRNRKPPAKCSECGHRDILFKGFGTELVEHTVTRLFPQARIARMDGESMRRRHAHEDLFQQLKSGEIDILIGTQMAAKGLDFPGITLIAVVSGDTSLMIPDFRAAERTFQLMTQVSGRAGRGSTPGRVFIQTYTPAHYSFQAAAKHDFESFSSQELGYRREARYPPFGTLVRIIVQGEDELKVDRRSEEIATALRPRASASGLDLLGPSPAPIAFLKRLHRRHLVLRGDEGRALEDLLMESVQDLRSNRTLQVLVDRDPTSMM